MLKAYIMKKYSLQVTQEEHARIIYNDLNTKKKKTEPSLNITENGKLEKAKCFAC